MKMNISPVRTLELRRNSAEETGGGTYHIAEIAIVDNVAGDDFVTALGVAVRQDEMSDTVKKQREAAIAAAKVSNAKYLDTVSRQSIDASVLDTVKTAENSVVPTTVTV